MKNILTLFFLLCGTAEASSPFIFKGSFAKNLAASGIEVSNSTTKQIIDVNVDPRAGGGVSATIGSLAMGAGNLYVKFGAANTDWLLVDGTQGSPDTVAGYDSSGELYSIPGWSTINNLGQKSPEIYQAMVASSDPGAVSIKASTFETDLDAQVNSTGTSYFNMFLDAHYDRPNSGFDLIGSWTNLSLQTNHEGSGSISNMYGIQSTMGNTGGGDVANIYGIQSIIAGSSSNITSGFESSINGNSANSTAGAFNITGNTTNNAIAVNSSISGNHTNGFTLFNGGFTGSTAGNSSLLNLSAGAGTVTGNLIGASVSNNGGTNDWQGFLSAINGNVSGNTLQFNSYDNGNTTGSFTGVNVSKNGTSSNLLGVNVAFNSNSDSPNSTIFNGSDSGNHTTNKSGLNLQLSGSSADVTGAGINISGTYSNSVTGLNVDVGSATNSGSPVNRKSGANINGGGITTAFTHETASSWPTVVDGGNVLFGQLNVVSGTPITGTDYLLNNLSGGLAADDDFGTSVFGLGFASVGFVGQQSVTSGNTVDKSSLAVAGFSIPAGSTGGTVTDMAMYRTIAPVSAGGTLGITNLYAFKAENTIGDFSTAATNAFGIYLDDDGFKNYLGGQTRVGGASYAAPTEALDVSGNGRFSLGVMLEDPGAGTNKWTIQSPTLASDYTLTLPVNDGASGECLKTDGSGVTSWGACSAGGEWSLLGNTGTTAGTNFLGTTDAQELVFKTNNTERARFGNGANDYNLFVSDSRLLPAGTDFISLRAEGQYTQAGNSAKNMFGVRSQIYYNDTFDIGDMTGVYGRVTHGGAFNGDAAKLVGGLFYAESATDDTIATMTGVEAQTSYLGLGSLTNMFGVRVNEPISTTAATTATGLYIGDWSLYGTTAYNLYSAGSTALNLIEGDLQVNEDLILQEPGAGTDTVTIKAPATVTASYTLTLPVDDGNSGDLLTTNGSGVLSFTPPTPATPTIFGSRGTPRAIVAATGITAAAGHMSTTAGSQKIYVEGSGGAVDVSATPQIQAGTIDGQLMVICGRSQTNTVELNHGNGLDLNGDIILGANECITLSWDTSEWVELSRNN